MPRLRLKPREEYPFSTEFSVRITDLNYGGHLGNDRLLSLVHEARVAFLKAHGLTEMDCDGTALTQADAAIVYLGEAFAGDILRFEVSAGEATGSGFRLFYRIIRSGDNKKIALAETGMVSFDYNTKKVRPLAQKIKDICKVFD